MERNHSVRLTSSEMTSLWSGYMNDSMAGCTLQYFIHHCKDDDIKRVLEYALRLSQEHVKTISDIFHNEKIPIPKGFTQEDVHLDAPRLFSDSFYLYYIKGLATIGLSTYSTNLTLIARSDIAAYFNKAVASSVELMDKSREVMLNKGLFIRPPYFSIPKKTEFIHKKSFLSGFFGKDRPLTGIEVSHLVMNAQNNSLGRALMIGFAQVARSKNTREYFIKGADIAKKHVQVFHQFLMDSDLPAPSTWDTDVLNSTVAPFSDKLMMFHTLSLIATGVGNYGVSLAASPRADLATAYARLQVEIGQFAKDGFDMMIENGWMEQPPTADDRKGLASKR